MLLNVYTIEQSQEWDSIVRIFKDYDVYYLSGYAKAFQIHGDGEPLLFYYESKDMRGINVVMKRDIADDPRFVGRLQKETYFDFSTPYGYGGWLIEGRNDYSSLLNEYIQWCRSNSIVSEFVRFHPVLENHEGLDMAYDVIALGNTIAMDVSSPEAIWINLTKANRTKIRKARNNGIQVYRARCPALCEVFKELYDATMDKKNADDYYYFGTGFFDSILRDLPYNAQFFYAVKDSEVIAASILLSANGHLNGHLAAAKPKYQHLAPTNLLMYEAALWGSANGCKSYHIGGGLGSREDSLYAFKKSFYRGEPKQFHIGRLIMSPEKYTYLVGLCDDIKNNDYFPKYRG